MRIAYCSETYFPSKSAHTVQIFGFCDALAEQADEVMLVADKFSLTFAELSRYYATQNRFSLVELNSNLPKRLYGLAVCRKLFQLNPDLVVTRSIHIAFVTALFAIPTIYEAHTPPRANAKLTRFTLKMMAKFNGLKFVISITDNLKDDLIEISPSLEKKILVLPTGGNVREAKPSFNLAGNFRIGYAGSFYQGKVLELILKIAESCPEVDFHLAGDNNPVLADQRYPTNIHFHGHLPPASIGSFLSSADCLIAPYSTEVYDCSGREISRWMSPLKIFEYMATGKPILARGLPGLKEVLTDQSAIIIDSDQVVEWVKAIQYIRENKEEAQALGSKAKQQLLADYSWSKRVEKVMVALGKELSRPIPQQSKPNAINR